MIYLMFPAVELIGSMAVTSVPVAEVFVEWPPRAFDNESHRNYSISSDLDAGAVVENGGGPPTQPLPLELFGVWYQGIHGYLSIVVCTFGILSNLVNVAVLTRPHMFTPTNCLLTAIAVADLMTMASYLPYAAYFYCYAVLDYDYGHPRGWIVYRIFHNNFTITSHTAAMWLTVSLAVFRYVTVCRHAASPRLCNLRRAKLTVVAVFAATGVFCVPIYVTYRAVRMPDTAPDVGHYWIEYTSFVTSLHIAINYWLYGVVLKVAPCVLLTLLSLLLISAMRTASRNRLRLRRTSITQKSTERDSEHNRTTAMLVAVVLFFVATELPQGVITLLSGIDERIFEGVYVPLGDVWDILVLVNSAVNFVLYCTMSRQYRETFSEIFFTRTVAGGRHVRRQSYYSVRMSAL